MSTKTLTVKEEAYNRLLAKKKTNESFSDVILRITSGSSVLGLANILNKKEAESLEKNVLKNKKLFRKRFKSNF